MGVERPSTERSWRWQDHQCWVGGKYNLMTLFNIVEAPLKKNVELWCLCCMMMFRWTIKQPGLHKFWNLCSLYQDIYDWISPLNKWSGRPFILTQQSVGKNEWYFWSLPYFCFLKHLTLIRLGYFGGWKDWGGGGGGHDGPPPPLEISAVDRAIAAKISTMVVCDVIYKIVYLDFPKYIFILFYIN